MLSMHEILGLIPQHQNKMHSVISSSSDDKPQDAEEAHFCLYSIQVGVQTALCWKKGVWQQMPVIPALRKLRQEFQEFKDILDYTVKVT